MNIEITNINPDNSIVLCRNVWPYLPKNEYRGIIQKLYNQLGKNSMLVVGLFDHTAPNILNLHQDFLDAGFKPVKGFYIDKYKEQVYNLKKKYLVYLKPSAKQTPISLAANFFKKIFTKPNN